MRADARNDRLPYCFGIILGGQVLAVGGGTADTAPVMMVSK